MRGTRAGGGVAEPPPRLRPRPSAPRPRATVPARAVALPAPLPSDGFVADGPGRAARARSDRRRVLTPRPRCCCAARPVPARSGWHGSRTSAPGAAGRFVAVDCGALPAERCEAALFGYVAARSTGALPRDMRACWRTPTAARCCPTSRATSRCRCRPRCCASWTTARSGRAAARARSTCCCWRPATPTSKPKSAAKRLLPELLFRLDTIRIELPPLRGRSDFARCARATLQRIDPAATLSDAAIARLALHRWPGNFRELHAVLSRAVLLHPTGRLDAADLRTPWPAADTPAAAPPSALRRGVTESVRAAVARCGGSISEAARALGIARTTVYRHLRQP
jgi:hypothetical protein